MHSFFDRRGFTWEVNINVSQVKRVKDALDVDLLRLDDENNLNRLAQDPVLLADVLFVLCSKQAKDRGVDDVQFGEQLAGDTIEDATTAFLEELVSFFPNQKRRVLAKALDKIKAVEAQAAEAALLRLDSAEMNEAIAGVIRGETSTPSPPSAA